MAVFWHLSLKASNESDAEKIKASLVTFTKSDKRGYAGVDSVERITSAALPVVYSKLSKKYTERTGKEFALNVEE